LKKAAWAVDSLLLILLPSILIWPLFTLEYMDNWPSIESTFIADARMLSEHLPHPGWQPLWYTGTRFDYVYPPALRYGTALISRFGGVSPARAYHLYTAIFYVLGIAAVYWLVRAGSGSGPGDGSRMNGWLAAAGTALLSPSFLLLPVIRHDSGFWVPQKLHVLMAYGEGPHISALSVLTAALAVSLLALRRGRPFALAGAAVLCALTVSTNFYGATSLAILFPIAVWSVWIGQRERRVWWRAAGISAVTYALCASWLTPSYLKITVTNLQWVALPGNNWSRLLALVAIAFYCGVTWKWGDRRPEREWSIFVAGAGFFLSLYVLGFFYFGLRITGEPQRLIPELDLALLLVLFELVRAMGARPNLRLAAVCACLVAFYPAVRYLKHVYSPFPKAGPIENRYEFVIAKWVNDHLPGERVLPSGTVRFWFDAWFDNSQSDGGSDQGLLNQALPTGKYQIIVGDRGDVALLWLEALGDDAIIVPDKTSFEPYHDYAKPEKFRGVAPVLYDDQHGTIIYRVPRRYPGIGRLVDTARIGAVGPIHSGDDVDTLTRYVAAIEQAPAAVQWKGFDEASVQAQAAAGQSVLLQESYDPAWRAYENGKPVPIRVEPVMNFMLIDVAEGNHNIQLRFETPLENRIGQGIALLGLAIVAGLFVAGIRGYK
jgi:hypothetical protein